MCLPIALNEPDVSVVLARRYGSKRWNCIGLGNGGACWLASHLYEQLELDRFWAERLPTGDSAQALLHRAWAREGSRSSHRWSRQPGIKYTHLPLTRM